MLIDVSLLPAALSSTTPIHDRTVVVVDVLRATSTMVVACHHGVERIIPVETLEDAYQLHQQIPGALLAGERDAKMPEDFDFDNSPVAMQEAGERLQGKTMILRTSNGTQLIKRLEAMGAQSFLMGSFLNLAPLTRKLIVERQDLLICCAGSDHQTALEDVGFAGALIDRLKDQEPNVSLTDSARIALSLWHHAYQNVEILFSKSNHTKQLLLLGKERDIRFVAQGQLEEIPRFYRESGCIRSDVPVTSQEA